MAAARALLIQRVAVTNGSRAMAARRMTVCVMRVLTSHNAHGIKFAVAAAAIHRGNVFMTVTDALNVSLVGRTTAGLAVHCTGPSIRFPFSHKFRALLRA